jgi:tetratricopeptide (TPR) repeat protein
LVAATSERTAPTADDILALGVALYEAGRPSEAVIQFERALALGSDRAEAHNDLGVALDAVGRRAEALDHYRRAIALKPGLADPYTNVGKLLMDLGQIEAAQTAFAAAVALAPHRGMFYFNLAHVKRFTADDPYLTAMENLARNPKSLGEEDHVKLQFALAKAYADLGAHERAFCHLHEGNARKRRMIAYDEGATLDQLARVRRVFDAPTVARASGAGNPSDLPVFIVGMPRSGTTLVEQILASHPEVYGAGELYDLDRLVRGLASGAGGFPEIVADLTAAQLHDLGTAYLAGLEVEKPTARRVTDKMPWNYRFVGLIRLILPNARIIHVRRDPIDTCLSCFSKLFGANQEFSYDLAELGRYYRAYRALMDHWRAILPVGAMLEVEYEELVADFAVQARRIVAHCGLDWHEGCLDFHRTVRPVLTASAVQVRQPIYRTATEYWRPYRVHAGPLIQALGA